MHKLHELICDTLTFLRDPLCPKQTIFSSAEEVGFFRSKRAEGRPAQVGVTPPYLAPRRAEPVLNLKPPKKAAVHSVEIETKTPPVKVKQLPETPVVENFDKIKSTLQRIAPHLPLEGAIPDDTSARKIATAWKEKIPDVEVILLACRANEETLELLKSLAKAIDQNLAKAKILPAEKLEREGRWELFLQKNPFRLIVASSEMKQLPALMRFYRTTSQGSESLDKIPLLALKQASYYKSIEHKAHLWKTLCQLLKK